MLSIAPLVSPVPCMRPGVDQRGGQIGDRPAHRLGDMLACGRVLLLLQRLDAEHEARDALRLVDLDDAIGELHRFIDFAVDQKSERNARSSSTGFFGSARSAAR